MDKDDSDTEEDKNDSDGVMNDSPILEMRERQDDHEDKARNRASELEIATRATQERGKKEGTEGKKGERKRG